MTTEPVSASRRSIAVHYPILHVDGDEGVRRQAERPPRRLAGRRPGRRPDVDAVVDDLHASRREPLAHEVTLQVLRYGEHAIRYVPQHLVRGEALARRRPIGQSSVLGEHQPRGPQDAGDASVYERRVLMAVDHVRAMSGGDRGDSYPERRPEPGPASEGADGNPGLRERLAPRAALVDAADGHRDLAAKTIGQIANEPFGAARREAQADEQDTGRPARRHRGRIRAEGHAGRRGGLHSGGRHVGVASDRLNLPCLDR
jgi:hypothetical protein